MPIETLDVTDRVRRSQGRASRTLTATVRVSRGEHAELKAAAKAKGMALSEWAREALLREVRPQPSAQAIFTELLQMRSLLEGLLAPLAIGQKLTPTQVNGIAEEATAKKHKRAAEALEQYRITGGQA